MLVFMKKYLPYILIGVVIIGAIGPVGVKITHASVLSFLGIGDIAYSAVLKLFAFVGYIILTIVSQLVSISGYLLEASVKYSIADVNIGGVNTIVKDGWTIARDIANLFFIFILLYIAIATILQLSGYGMKELLVKVVIIALLVNFSLMITSVIIDASNILATEFYNKLTDIKIEGTNTKVSLSTALTAGLDPQTLFKVDTTTEGTLKLTGGAEATLTQILIITLFGSVMLVIIAFVYFAAAILFVIRIAVLWLLMMLAPLAFLAMALPKTQEYSKKWWSQLFNQAFFAPIYLFLLYIVIKIIAGGAVLKQLGVDNANFGTAFGSPNDANVKLILGFIILITLTVATLIIAKTMGAYGAGTVMKWGKDAKKWGQGYAGRVNKRYVGRAATAAEGALEKERESKFGRGFAKTLKAVPFLQRGIAKTAQLKKKEIGRYEKDYGSYDTQTLNQLRGKMGTTSEAKMAITKILEKRGVEGPRAELIKRENEEVKGIDMRLNEHKIGVGLKETDAIEKVGDFYEDKITEFGVALDATPYADEKKRIELTIKKRMYEKLSKNVDSLEKRKKEIEANKQRRKEMEEIEERVSAAEKKAGEASEKAGAKPPPPASKT